MPRHNGVLSVFTNEAVCTASVHQCLHNFVANLSSVAGQRKHLGLQQKDLFLYHFLVHEVLTSVCTSFSKLPELLAFPCPGHNPHHWSIKSRRCILLSSASTQPFSQSLFRDPKRLLLGKLQHATLKTVEDLKLMSGNQSLDLLRIARNTLGDHLNTLRESRVHAASIPQARCEDLWKHIDEDPIQVAPWKTSCRDPRESHGLS